MAHGVAPLAGPALAAAAAGLSSSRSAFGRGCKTLARVSSRGGDGVNRRRRGKGGVGAGGRVSVVVQPLALERAESSDFELLKSLGTVSYSVVGREEAPSIGDCAPSV